MKKQIDVIFNKAGISKAEVADTDHWFTQSQADRFYEAVVAETEDDQIARKAGRFAASAFFSFSSSFLLQSVGGLLK